MMFIDGLQSWPIFDLCLRSAREHKLQDAPRFRCLNHCQMDLGKSSFLRMRTAWRSILETLTTSPAWSRTLAGCNNITIQSIPNCYSAQKTEMADFFPPRYRGFACCGKPRKEKKWFAILFGCIRLNLLKSALWTSVSGSRTIPPEGECIKKWRKRCAVWCKAQRRFWVFFHDDVAWPSVTVEPRHWRVAPASKVLRHVLPRHKV